MPTRPNVRIADNASLRTLRILALSIFFLGLASIMSGAHADDEFSAESIDGVWGFSAAGTIVPPAFPAPTAAVAVGTMTFDGDGYCSISDTINIGGTVASRTSTTCSYTVNGDGTGSISVSFPGDPGPTPLDFVIVNDEEELRFIRSDLGVASGVAKLQDP